MEAFVVDGAEVAQGGVAAGGVVPGFDPFEDRVGEFGCGCSSVRRSSSSICIEPKKTRPGHCRRRSRRPSPWSRAGRRCGGVDRTAQEVYWLPWSEWTMVCRPAGWRRQRAMSSASTTSLGAQVVGDRPAHDPAGEHVQDDRAVDPALAGAVLGDVGDPQPVRPVSANRRSTRSSWQAGAGWLRAVGASRGGVDLGDWSRSGRRRRPLEPTVAAAASRSTRPPRPPASGRPPEPGHLEQPTSDDRVDHFGRTFSRAK